MDIFSDKNCNDMKYLNAVTYIIHIHNNPPNIYINQTISLFNK